MVKRTIEHLGVCFTLEREARGEPWTVSYRGTRMAMLGDAPADEAVAYLRNKLTMYRSRDQLEVAINHIATLEALGRNEMKIHKVKGV